MNGILAMVGAREDFDYIVGLEMTAWFLISFAVLGLAIVLIGVLNELKRGNGAGRGGPRYSAGRGRARPGEVLTRGDK